MNRKRSVSVLLAAVMLALGLTGCTENQIPDLTEEEMQAVGEYVAITMMKYDMNHQSRLMDLQTLSEEKAEESVDIPESGEAAGMGEVEDTPVIDAVGGDTQTANTYSMEEVIGLAEGVTLTFQSHTICDSYPEGNDVLSAGFSLDASAGKKLLVLHFLLTNTTGQEQSIDLFSSDELYTITVNNEYSRRALTTMLLEDLTTYEGTLPAEGSSEVVLVAEVGEEMADNVTSVSLKVRNEEKEYTIQLLQ